MSDRVLVMASGGGSTMERLFEDIGEGYVDAEIAGIVCNNQRPEDVLHGRPQVWEKAERLGIPIHYIDGEEGDTYPLDEAGHVIPFTHSDEEAQKIDELALDEGVAAIFMMGYMRRARQLTPSVNWHPAPLPQTAGKMLKDAQKEVMRLGLSYSGPTVHWVDPRPGDSGVPEYDVGSVITHLPVRITEIHRQEWTERDHDGDDCVESLSNEVVASEKDLVAGSAAQALTIIRFGAYPYADQERQAA